MELDCAWSELDGYQWIKISSRDTLNNGSRNSAWIELNYRYRWIFLLSTVSQLFLFAKSICRTARLQKPESHAGNPPLIETEEDGGTDRPTGGYINPTLEFLVGLKNGERIKFHVKQNMIQCELMWCACQRFTYIVFSNFFYNKKYLLLKINDPLCWKCNMHHIFSQKYSWLSSDMCIV